MVVFKKNRKLINDNEQLRKRIGKYMNKKIAISLITISLSLFLNSAVLIEGDKDASTGKTFSFNVNKNILSAMGNFYEGANEILTSNQEFSLSRLPRGTTAFVGITPETVCLNGRANVTNPLFGDKIIALGMLETEDGFSARDMPIAVGANRPATVYLLDNIEQLDNVIMASSHDVHDATGAVSPGVVNLATNGESHVFAAVKPNDGEFGDPNSGIAMIVRGTMSVPQNEEQEGTITIRVFDEINANTGELTPPQALRLDATSPALFINNTLSTIAENHAIMHWDNSLSRLYIGLNVTANNGATDGARSIAAVKFIENGAIELETIAPDTVFTASNTTSIIGAIGANQELSINALKTMYTSTALHYLILVGGNGTAATTKNSVLALPLVNSGDAQGMIAQKTAKPVNVFKDANVPRLIARTITEAATTPAEMTQSTDIAAIIGGGQLTTGPIVDIIVRNDTVYAFVGEETPGVYSSQAIFDATGKITSWTNWQRAAGTTDTIFGASLNPFDGSFILASGTSADTIETIKKTIWSDGSSEGLEPLTSILNSTLSSSVGGIQGLQTFLPNNPGLNDIALLAAGGIGTVVIAQTGLLNNNGIIIPTEGMNFDSIMSFDNGTITKNVDATTVVVSGGALDSIGPITALEVARNTTYGWFFLGGSNGLTILTQPDGTGWNATTQLGDKLNGLESGMLFKLIGNYTFVKKLIYDGDNSTYNYLYVIAHDRIDRINLDTSDFGNNMLDVTTIASSGHNDVTKTGGFLDGIFSQACGIIATTDNLLRIGNDKDVRTITNEADAQWTNIPIGENAGAPTGLYTVTKTNRAQDITRNNGGHFYVLTADVGLDQSRINRFAVQTLTAAHTMNNATVQQFDDLFVQNIPSFLLSFGEFRSNFSTDGALYFATRNQNIDISPVVLLTPAFPVPRVGVNNVGNRSSIVDINIQQGTEINYFSRSQASGSWITAGNFNTQVLE